jgi:hypothetical protein
MLEEAGDTADGVLDIVHPRQGDQAEVVGLGPVETGALHDQQFFLQQQVVHHLLIVLDVVYLGIQLGEHVDGALGLDAGHPGDLVEQLPGLVPLLAQPATGQHQLVDALVAAQRRLDAVLHGHVGAQPHGGEHLQPLDIVPGQVLGATEHHPALAEAGGAIALRQAVEGGHQHVVAQGADRVVGHVVVQDLVVDLVGEDDEPVLAGDFHHFQQELAAVDGAGGVVGVDQHYALGAGADLGLDVVQVRVPVGLLVAHIVHRLAAGQGNGGGPERVVGGGHQHLVTVVEQGLHRHHDQLRHPVADVDVFQVGGAQPLLLVVLHHRLARREESLGIAVALAGGHVEDGVLEQLLRGLEAEGRRVADIELEDAVTLVLQAAGLLVDGAADVVTDVVQLVRFLYGIHGYQGPRVMQLPGKPRTGEAGMRRGLRERRVRERAVQTVNGVHDGALAPG